MRILSIPLIVIFITNMHASASSITRKGCQFGFGYEVHGKTLSMSSCFCGFDCDFTPTLTQVFFGNEDSAAWNTTDVPYQASYTYPEFGLYTVQVYLDGHFSSKFDVLIGQDTTSEGSCDSSFVCGPSFDYELLYSQTKQEYFLTCVRTDTCQSMQLSWIIGPSPAYVNVSPVTIPFGKIEEASVVPVCLKLHYIFCDSTVCRDILFTKGNATIIDAIQDSTPALYVFPNPVRDELEVEVVNLKDNVTLTFYSFDGRTILNYELEPSALQKDYLINLQSFPSGIYFMKAISGDNYSSVQKIVKE